MYLCEMAKILIINGPNLNLLGTRETDTYGVMSLQEIENQCVKNFPKHQLSFFQSNIEGELIDAIQRTDAEAIVLNAGGYTHTSVAIRDAIAASELPVVEVHISNISSRESFRHTSLLSPVCAGVIFGFGIDGYGLAVVASLRLLGYDF